MRTPTIDALANSGIILERHYGFMFCSPSRCAFLSGRLPIHVNQGQPQGVLATGGVDLHMTTIGEKMQAAQFYTAWFGKWYALDFVRSVQCLRCVSHTSTRVGAGVGLLTLTVLF